MHVYLDDPAQPLRSERVGLKRSEESRVTLLEVMNPFLYAFAK